MQRFNSTFLILVLAISFVVPFYAPAHAECDPNTDTGCYTLLAQIPLGSNDGSPVQTTSIAQYLPNLVKLIIGLATMTAVIRLIVAGFKYAAVESFTGKSSAKQDINNALVGLLLAISAYSILYTIDPSLVNIDFTLQNVGSNTPLDSSVCAGTLNADGTCTAEGEGGITGAYGGVLNCDDAHNCDYKTPGDKGGWGPLTNGNTLNGIPNKGCDFAGYNCQVSSVPATFFAGLTELNSAMGGTGWRVTEAWPPSYKHHISRCHQPGSLAGQCVDAALMQQNASPATVRDFLYKIQGLKNAGQFGSFQYEISCPKPPEGQDQSVCVDKTALARFHALKEVLGSTYKLVINIGATGEHVHINAVGVND